MEPGLLLSHKACGETSSSLVQALRTRAAAEDPGAAPPALCHGGALDPFAEGLLLLLAGPVARLFEDLHPIPKVYETQVVWGAETDTCDPFGQLVAEGDAAALGEAQLEAALWPFRGWHLQTPPATSNKRVDGERAWARAHRGEEVVLQPVPVFLHEARFLSHDLPRSSRLLLVVRGGFYVRSLARDLGRALGARAHLGALHRTAIGPWQDPGHGHGREAWIRGAALLPWLRSRVLTEEEAQRVELGRPIPRGVLAAPAWALPEGFAGPGSGPPAALLAGAPAKSEPGPVLGLCDGTLRVIVRERGDQLVLRTDLGGGV